MEYTYLPIDEFKKKVGEYGWSEAFKNPRVAKMKTDRNDFDLVTQDNISKIAHALVIELSVLSSPDYGEKRSCFLLGFKTAHGACIESWEDGMDTTDWDMITSYFVAVNYAAACCAMLDLQKNERILCSVEKSSAERARVFGSLPLEGEHDARN